MNTSEWMECVRWCHSDQNHESLEPFIENLVDLERRSPYPQTVLTNSWTGESSRAAGYVILYPGALASIGNLRFESELGTRDGRGPTMLANIVRQLSASSWDCGVEIIQAISPLVPSRIAEFAEPAFVAVDPLREQALAQAGLQPMARLVQLECPDMRSFAKLDTSRSQFPSSCAPEMVSFELLPSEHWCALVEATYVDTRDVPELNGRRRIENTLAGYASSCIGTPTSWWCIRNGHVDIGCLLLTPMGHETCEVTYLGLIPEWRGLGLAKWIMNFVHEWALAREFQRLSLAVDVRNVPAIRLYQSCGFVAERFVQAWIGLPNS